MRLLCYPAIAGSSLERPLPKGIYQGSQIATNHSRCSKNLAAVIMDASRVLYLSIDINTTVGRPPVKRLRHLLTRYSINRSIPGVMLVVKRICKASIPRDGCRDLLYWLRPDAVAI